MSGHDVERIQMPRWLWGVFVAMAAAAVPMVGEVYSLRVGMSEANDDITDLRETMRGIEEQSRATREEQLRRTNPVYGVADLKTEIVEMRKMLETVRDDVTALKVKAVTRVAP